MKTITTQIFLFLCVLSLFAQKDSDIKPTYKLQAHDIQVSMGGFNYGKSELPIAGLLLNNQNSKEYYQKYFDGQNASINHNSGINFQLLMGFRFKNKSNGNYNKRMSLRLGLHYQDINLGLLVDGNFGFKQFPNQIIDANTFIKSDSTYSEIASTFIRAQALYASSALLFYTKPDNQLQFYGGVGLSMGFFLQNELQNRNSLSNYRIYMTFINNQPQYESTQYIYYQNENSSFDVPVGYRFWTFINVPLGFRMRLGVNNNITNRIYLGLELQSGIQLTSSKAQGFKAGFASMQMLTLNYAFRK